MIGRPVDSDGDLMPVAYAEQMESGGKAVAQVVRQRLLLYFGEWWEDEQAGFRIPQFLYEGVRSNNIQMLLKYISSYVASTDGVDSVDSAVIEISGREMTYKCLIHTGLDSNVVEVMLDGLLSTEY